MSPTREQKIDEYVRQDVDDMVHPWRWLRSEGRNGRPRPETPFSAMNRERAEQKRARRRERRLNVDRWGYVR